MRILTILSLLLGFAGTAAAHTPSGDQSLADQLVHHLLGLHHLPLTLIIVISGIVILGVYKRRCAPIGRPQYDDRHDN